MLLDKKNLNSEWADAQEKERACFREYQVFKDIGKNGRPPAGYKLLKILMGYTTSSMTADTELVW